MKFNGATGCDSILFTCHFLQNHHDAIQKNAKRQINKHNFCVELKPDGVLH